MAHSPCRWTSASRWQLLVNIGGDLSEDMGTETGEERPSELRRKWMQRSQQLVQSSTMSEHHDYNRWGWLSWRVAGSGQHQAASGTLLKDTCLLADRREKMADLIGEGE